MGISSTLVTDADFFFLRKVTDADDIATDAHDNLLLLYRPTFIYMHCEETYRLQPFTIEREHRPCLISLSQLSHTILEKRISHA